MKIRWRRFLFKLKLWNKEFCTYCSECGSVNKCYCHKLTSKECLIPNLRQEYCSCVN